MANAIIAAVILAAVFAAPARDAVAAVTCRDAVNALIPCGSFLLGVGPPHPSGGCCQSALALRRMADSVDARRALCRCLVQSGPSFGVLPERAQLLPARCGLNLTMPVSPNTDCDKIS